MPRLTQAEYLAYEAKRIRKWIPPGSDKACDDEAELHQSILQECADRGWLPFHGSMVHKTHRTPGEPDFIIMAGNGRTYYIEAKTRKGKLSMDQLSIQAWSHKLGHTVHVVRSFGEFLKAIDNPIRLGFIHE